MEPTDDPKLRELLNEWQIPDAPRSLDERVLGPRKRWWSFLLTGSIRIPVPAAIAIAFAFLIIVGVLLRSRRPTPQPAASVNLADFQPVKTLNYRVIRRDQ